MSENDKKVAPSPAAPAAVGAGGDPAHPERGSAGVDLAGQVARLEKALAEKTEEAASNFDRYLRERAELENFKKRMQRERAEGLRFASEGLVRDLLSVIDNLERAIEHANAGGNGQPLAEGVAMILKSALDVLGQYGVTRVEAVGERFDPSLHEAIAQVIDPAREPNLVVEQLTPGYRLHERLLRPARVTVSAKPTVEKGGGDD